MQDHWTVQVKATPEQIWLLVGDLQHHGDWSSKAYRANWLSGEPNAVGSRLESFGWVPDPTGVMKVMWPVLSAVLVHPGTQKGMEMLKAKAEAAAGAGSGSAS